MSTETIKIHYCFEDEEVQILEVNSNCTVTDFVELARNALGNQDINCAYLNRRLLDDERLLTQCSKDIKNDVFVVSDDPMKSFKISLKFNQVKYKFNNGPIHTIKVNYYCKVCDFINLARKELSNQDIIYVFYKGEQLDLEEALINHIDDFDTDILIVSDDPDKIIDEREEDEPVPPPAKKTDPPLVPPPAKKTDPPLVPPPGGEISLKSNQVKYKFNNGPIHTIKVNYYCKVCDFINLARKELSNQDIICVFYKGEQLDLEEALINHIDDFDTDILIVSDDPDKIIDESEEDEPVPPPVKKIDPPVVPPKTILKFTIFTTATIDSFFTGDVLHIDPTDSYNKICQQIREIISNFKDVEIPEDYELQLYLPCGVPFLPGENPDETSLEEFINVSEKMKHYIYVVITKKLGKFINKKVPEPCNCTEEFKMMISPLFESSESGLTQMASLLGYFYHNGINGEYLLLSLARLSRFPPLIVNLYRFLEHEKLTVRNIVAITGPLFTLFDHFLKGEVNKENVLERTLRIISFFSQINYDEFLDLQTFDLDEEEEFEVDDSDDPNQKLMSYFISTGQQKHMVIWRIDIDPNEFEREVCEQPAKDIFDNDQILDAIKIYKPVAPLSLRFIHYPTFIKSNNENEVLLYLNEDSEKDNCINYIDPKVGKIEQISIEELAKKLRNKEKENFLSLIDGNFVDQIVIICFDESTTMKRDITNHSVRDGKPSRFQIAKEILKSFVAQSCRLRVSSIYGLIGFGNEVIVRQKLTALSSQFIESMKNIEPKGKTLLYDALNKAQDMILEITVPKNSEEEEEKEEEEAEKDVPYPYATSRIIVITDGCDNKSLTSPIDLANSLVGNRIIVDTVLISTTDQNKCMCALSQITGGLCFRPKSVKEGIEFFEQEAFLNIKMRRINEPYNKRVTKKIFEDKAESFNEFDEKVKNKALRKANTKFPLATPLYMNYIYKYNRKKQSIRIHRAIKELNTIVFHPSDNYVVYSSYHAPEEWRIFIKGPKETPFVNKWLNLFMNLPPNYPTQPPSFRFLTVPFHPNISREGRVVFSLLDKNYNPNLGINTIIEGIVKLLKDPEQKLAINNEASKLFKNYEAYQNKQREEDIGVDDYHEYIEGTEIHEDIPEGADIIEAETFSQLIVTNHFDSQKGKVLPKSSDDPLYS